MLRNFNYNGLKIVEVNFISIHHLSSIESFYDIVKILINPENEDCTLLQKNGYIFADRILDVCIPLSKIDNIDKMIRLPILKTNNYKKDILEIAKKSFPYDRRFHLQPKYSQEFANVVIEDWIDKLNEVYVCLYKDLPIGFLSLMQIDDKNSFVYLAAVDEKYKMTGAAMSLYAKAIQVSKENNHSNLNGRISCRNIAVMNLYNHFGAKFSNPVDIYIKANNEFK